MITTLLAVCVLATTQQNAPTSLPPGSIATGRDTFRVDRTFNEAKSVVSDPNLKGGHRATLRYIYWVVYVRPTGNFKIQAAQACNHECENPGEHSHPMCTIGGCAAECPFENHNVQLNATTETSRSTTVERALQLAKETVLSVSANAGVSAGPVEAGLSATSQTGTTETESISSSITTAISQSVSGSVEINLSHFNKSPCTSEKWFFGTREFEIRLRTQVLEQDYFADSWTIGGAHGVQPSGRLKTTGEPRFVGRPEDVRLGTYQVPSNEPVKKDGSKHCGCKPKPVITPGPTGSHKTTPTGTSHFYVEPYRNEKVVFSNPTSEPLFLSYADIKVTLQPAERREVVPMDHDGDQKPDATTVVLTMPDGRIYTAATIKPNSQPRPASIVTPKLDDRHYRTVMADLERVGRAAAKKKGNVEMQWKVEEGEKGAPPEPTIDQVTVAPERPNVSGVQFAMFAGVPGSLPIVGNDAPVLHVRGNLRPGLRATLKDPMTGEPVCETTSPVVTVVPDGSAASVDYFIKLPPINGESLREDAQLELSDEGHKDWINLVSMSVYRPNFRLSIDPISGLPGTPATMTVDSREVLAFMMLTRHANLTDYDLVIDYSAAGGASGPTQAPIPMPGINRLRVTRGSAAGGFQVAVGLKLRSEAQPMHGGAQPVTSRPLRQGP